MTDSERLLGNSMKGYGGDTYLQTGDIIKLGRGHVVYATLPNKYFNMSDDLREKCVLHTGLVEINDNTSFLEGLYVVTRTSYGGGGQAYDGSYPSGHHVICEKINSPEKYTVDFYQSGCFTATIKSIKVVGSMFFHFEYDHNVPIQSLQQLRELANKNPRREIL